VLETLPLFFRKLFHFAKKK